jgi:hypothetical protein
MKKTILPAAAAAVLISCVFLFIRSQAGLNDADIVAHIDGEPVTVREYAQALLRKRADVYAYFKAAHNADDHPDFWTTDYGGEVPLNKIKADALDELAAIKVQQKMAKEKGIVQDISYTGFLKELKAENARRRAALKKNQVIYGPQQYDETGYFDLVFENMKAELKRRLQDEMVFREEEVEAYYREHADQFQLGGAVTIKKITVSYSDQAEGNDQAEGKAEAEQVIKEIAARVGDGESWEEVAHAYRGDSSPKVELEEQRFEPHNARTDAMVWRDLFYAAQQLEVGQISDIIDYNGAFHVIRCIERTPGATIPLAEAEAFIKLELAEQKYAALVEQRIADAQVAVNDRVYRKVGEAYLR